MARSALLIECLRGDVAFGSASALLLHPQEMGDGFVAGTRLMRYQRSVLVGGAVAGRVSGVIATRTPSVRDIEHRIDAEGLNDWARVAIRGELILRHRVHCRGASVPELVVVSELINPFSGLSRRQVAALDAGLFVIRTESREGDLLTPA